MTNTISYRALRILGSYGPMLLAGAIACATSTAGQTVVQRLQPVRADTAALRKKLDSIADAHHGIVGYSVIDLESGQRISRRGERTAT